MRELTSAARSLKEGYESLLEKHKELECEKKSLLAEIAALNWKVQELERNLEYGAKVVVKTAEKLYYEKQQNKRYREALEEILKIQENHEWNLRSEERRVGKDSISR